MPQRAEKADADDHKCRGAQPHRQRDHRAVQRACRALDDERGAIDVVRISDARILDERPDIRPRGVGDAIRPELFAAKVIPRFR